MIHSITVTNYLGESIKLDLKQPGLSGFVVKSITGLSSGKATINMTEVATSDGAYYNSARLSSRNIVISLQYLWNPTIENMRHLSYKYFPIKKKVTLLFETDTRLAQIEGYVESNEADIFTKEEGSDISIICPNPFFYSAGEHGTQTTVFSGVEPMFEFPFGNESLTQPLLQMGSIQNRTSASIFYDGDAEIGVKISIYALGTASNITIYNSATRQSMVINTDKIASITGSGIILGDEITISTVKERKSITLLRDGTTTNILNCLDKNTDWFYLVKGENIFVYEAETGANNLQFRIENQTIYEGV